MTSNIGTSNPRFFILNGKWFTGIILGAGNQQRIQREVRKKGYFVASLIFENQWEVGTATLKEIKSYSSAS